MPPTMRQPHNRVFATTSSLFLCLLLLVSAASSKPVDSTKFLTLRSPLNATKTTLSAPPPTGALEPPPDVLLRSKVEDSTSRVNGMSIFWIVMPLSIACMTHPIGSACGLEPAYRHRIRIGPLISLFDTLHLLYEIYRWCKNMGDVSGPIHRIRNAIREVVEVRLKRIRAEGHGSDGSPQDNPQAATLLCRFESCLYNTPIRHAFSAVLVLQYAKLCGFHGSPMSFSLATGYFVSWIIMEIILLVGEGHAKTEPHQVAHPKSASSSEPLISGLVGRGVFLLQSIAVLVGVSMLLWKAQSNFKFEPDQGEMAPSFDLRFASFLVISSSLMYYADSMPIFVGISLMSGLCVSSRKNPRNLSDPIGMLMAAAYVFIITTVFYSNWVFGAAHLPFIGYITFFYASHWFCSGEKGKRKKGKGCSVMTQLEPVLVFGGSALTYAGGLLFFYAFDFNPEGTWRAGWTDIFP
ncbi:hypothetical protein C7212DRAFT_359459 [Tuber magnatum]|uniref:GPI ethanolamine phosphate transferase 1 n=1 Tax=Tuber magnatum TaxID=42249 RepID=A0A317SIF3_9PEZI|nr:hypothetical protein C7212DRAFT_359459 [Tuber magnatum]